MDTYPPYRSPPDHGSSRMKPEGRWGDRDEESYPRRSPGPPDRRYRPRNRSRSPINIDRYQPDGYHGAHSRERDNRRRAPSPGPANIDRYIPGQEEPRPIPTNPVPDPYKLEYTVGFSYFGEWWRHNELIKEERERQRNGGRRPPDRLRGDREAREDRVKEKAQIQAAYDRYKEAMHVKMARAFVASHKGEEWFKERYVPATRDAIRSRLNEVRRGTYGAWEQDLENGVFDEFTLEGIYKGDSNGQGGAVEKEEGEAVATAEVLGVGDLLPVKGGELRDEAAFQPALLIKTIAPTVSREKLEEFCKEHLGESSGGLKWLSLSDPNPSKRFHRIGWVMLHPGDEGDRVEVERAEAREGEEVDEDAMQTGSGKGGVAEKAQEAINGKTIHDGTRGDFTVHVGVHTPPSDPKKKALWDLFSAPERIARDLELAVRLVSKLDGDTSSEFDAVGKIEARVQKLRENGQLQPVVPTKSTKPKRRSSEVAEEEDGEEHENGEAADEMDEDEEDGAVDEEEIDDEDLLVTKKQLDLLVEYLRRVHNFCFFCVFESDSVHELVRKCSGGHLRRPRASLSSTAKAAAKASVTGETFPASKASVKEEDGGNGGGGDSNSNSNSKPTRQSRHASKNEQQLSRALNWVKTYEEKVLQLLEPEKVDLRKLGGKPMDEALDEELAKHVKQEDENKFRCKVETCTKLFKADHFWRKHVEKRHLEWYESIKQDIELVNNYVLDPSHIVPSRSDANANGHFPGGPGGNHHMSGTPRGFSLSHLPMGFNPALPGGGGGGAGMFNTPPGGGFPPFFTAQMSGVGGGPWAGGGPTGNEFMMGGGGGGAGNTGSGGPGPIRRGGGGGGGGAGGRSIRHPGPYDRRGRDSRDIRWGNNNGRLSPPRGMPGGGPPMNMNMNMGGMNMGMMGGGTGMGMAMGGGGGPGPGSGPGRMFPGGGGPGGPGPMMMMGGGGSNRWGDGMGTAGVGPREAVQGRSIKSYEDLDAVGGGGGGELNY
ncbi:MAG: hypothetical protein M1823_002666 [Watsoniomyces obsoletus]|nr:MAG: hypothetical protein M1823_002666 [Watsoniomyces obsoletus]